MKRIAILTALVLAAGLFFAGDLLAQQRGQIQPGQQIIRQEQAVGSGAVLTISPAQVRLIQQSLNQMGYDTGNVDGQWGQQTSSALLNFQQAIGLEPTGQINTRTLQALGLGNLLSGGQQQYYGVSPQFGQQQGQGFQQQPQQFQQQPQQFQQQPQQFQQQPQQFQQQPQQFQQQPQFQGQGMQGQ